MAWTTGVTSAVGPGAAGSYGARMTNSGWTDRSNAGHPMRVVVAGGGRIGTAAAALLAATGDYEVTLADQRPPASGLDLHGVEVRSLDAGDDRELAALLRDAEVVLNALPYHLTERVARTAAATGTHYLDLTEDVASSRVVRDEAASADVAFIPQCGLAPGFVSIAAHGLAQRFDRLASIAMRVGALPRTPTNALGYSLTWSTEGVINEYCNPCLAIEHGVPVSVPALEQVETLVVDGVRYEAFNTSGGLGTLTETYLGRLDTLDYKTIRYPGHRDIMKVLLGDLQLSEHRDELRVILERAIPTTTDDIVVVHVGVTGWRDGVLVEESLGRTIGHQVLGGRPLSAIQSTTAASACAVVDLLREGRIPARGLVRQEDITLEDFLANRFGSLYATGVLEDLRAPVAIRPLAGSVAVAS